MSEIEITESRRRYLLACGRHSVMRLPSGETRLYYDDGTYNSAVGAAIGELEAAGLVRVGAQMFAAGRAYRQWRFLDLTGAGMKAAYPLEDGA